MAASWLQARQSLRFATGPFLAILKSLAVPDRDARAFLGFSKS
jgi:hypothetical protein